MSTLCLLRDPQVIAVILLQVNYELRDFFFGKLKEADIEAPSGFSRLPILFRSLLAGVSTCLRPLHHHETCLQEQSKLFDPVHLMEDSNRQVKEVINIGSSIGYMAT